MNTCFTHHQSDSAPGHQNFLIYRALSCAVKHKTAIRKTYALNPDRQHYALPGSEVKLQSLPKIAKSQSFDWLFSFALLGISPNWRKALENGHGVAKLAPWLRTARGDAALHNVIRVARLGRRLENVRGIAATAFPSSVMLRTTRALPLKY